MELNKENYGEVKNASLPVVIDFWAEWCGPCRMVTPIVEALASEYAGKAIICKCDVEKNDDIVSEYMVRNIPTLVFLKEGRQVDKIVGACTRDAIVEKLEKLM